MKNFFKARFFSFFWRIYLSVLCNFLMKSLAFLIVQNNLTENLGNKYNDWVEIFRHVLGKHLFIYVFIFQLIFNIIFINTFS